MSDWQWREVRTREDAEAYVRILQYDAQVLGATQYPKVTAESLLAVAQDKSRGYHYWIAESPSTGAKLCYLIRVLPTDQGAPERNRPTVMQLGAMPGFDGVGWPRVYARAIGALCDHVQATAPALRAESKWSDELFRVIDIRRERAGVVATELTKFRDVQDVGDAFVHRFHVGVRRRGE